MPSNGDRDCQCQPELYKAGAVLEHEKTLSVLGGSFAFLFVLSLFLPFDSLWTIYLAFLAATIAACAMILSARILHEKTPDKKEPAVLNFLADTSYGVYLFHWPFFIIFSQHLGNMMAALVTTIVSLILTALSFYIWSQPLQARSLVSLV